MNTRTYKIRKFANGKNRRGFPFINYSLTIPSQIAEQLPENMQFSCELTKDGLLFRPVSPEQEAVVLPEWAQANGTAQKTEKKKPTRKRPTRGGTKPASKTRSKPKPKSDETKEPEQPQEPQEPEAPADASEVTA
jgi:hypothetical protein